MTPLSKQPGTPSSLRSTVIAIALVPSLVFIGTGLGVGWYLSEGAVRQQAEADLIVGKVDISERFRDALLDERRASALADAGLLADARLRLDEATAGARGLALGADADIPAGLRRSLDRLPDATDAADGIARIRRQVDSGATGMEAYRAFATLVESTDDVLSGSGVEGMSADVDTTLDAAGALSGAATALDGAGLIAAISTGQPLDPPAYREFSGTAGDLQERIEAATAELVGVRHDEAVALLSTPEWQRSIADANVVLAAGPGVTGSADPERSGGVRQSPPLPADYAAETAAMATGAAAIAFAAGRDAAALQSDRAGTTLATIVTVVLAIVGIAVVALIVAFRTSGRLLRRLGRIRDETLEASVQLPAILDRVRRGEEIDLTAAVPDLDHGTDEIGQVAAAVNSAQRAALDAAGEEARTRAGANAVFLNIAHRSQALVHRQLQLLDEAERAEHNSEQLARLFQLDHLTTRERRNAENLIIMGGQQPRRQWRRPVSLTDLVRSAVAESEQYTRITLGDVPEVFVQGTAVGDLIHLLAELVDNATAFSPPQCPIDVHATAVGRGVVVEVRDRGLGIEPEPRARLNSMLADPPDFGMMTLSDDSRLGIFVVGRLAHRLGARVTLAESPYGGVQAIVLVPAAILVDPADAGEPDFEPSRTLAGTNGEPATVGPPATTTRPAGDAAAGDAAAGDAEAGDAEAADPIPPTVTTPTAATPTAATPTAATPTAATPTPAAAAVPPAGPVGAAALPDQPPPLPERRPQVHLARELREEPQDPTDAGEELPIHRSRAAMAALQKGARDSRGPGPSRNGDRP